MAAERPEIGSDAWIAAQIAAGLPPEERDRPTPQTGDGQKRPAGR